MMNYISINNQKIELTEEQIEKIRASIGVSTTKLSDIAVGETFKCGKYEFIVLEHSKETTAVILKDLLCGSKQFGSNNNYNGSYMDCGCNEFADTIAEIIGKKNIVEHTVDLTSDDGLKDYGKVKRRMSLLTANLYRRYVEILDKHKIDGWWWLATPHSTSTHGNSSWVKCVSPSGNVINHYYDDFIGFRPFCILDSNIFVSK